VTDTLDDVYRRVCSLADHMHAEAKNLKAVMIKIQDRLPEIAALERDRDMLKARLQTAADELHEARVNTERALQERDFLRARLDELETATSGTPSRKRVHLDGVDQVALCDALQEAIYYSKAMAMKAKHARVREAREETAVQLAWLRHLAINASEIVFLDVDGDSDARTVRDDKPE
jgi:chromosome segregation ATPase